MNSHSDSELASNTCKRLHAFKAKAKGEKKDYLQVLKAGTLEVGQKSLLNAVSSNNVDGVLAKLVAGADPNSSDNIGRSALHLAVSRGYVDIVRLLLQYGADPNRRDVIHNTPLHLAACSSNLSAITLLIDGGADLGQLDINGRSPLQLARSKLTLLRKSWREGQAGCVALRAQAIEVVDLMRSLWSRRGQRRDDDLELVKRTLRTGGEEQVGDEMDRLLLELRDFSIE